MYVTLVFRVKGSRLVKPSLCLALLCPAFLVGVVRVAEYRNHWSDVLAGFLTGAAIATFLVSPSHTHPFWHGRPSSRSPWPQREGCMVVKGVDSVIVTRSLTLPCLHIRL